jgi:alpha-beta hydrolase superfamily lysophospholipase
MTNVFFSLIGILLVLFFLLMAFLHFNQEKIIFFPETLPAEYSFSFDLPFEEVFLEAPDGARLNALHFRAQNPKGVVLFFHGNAGSLRSWGMVAKEFVERNHDLFILDYRTFGKSTGTLSEEAMHADARMAYTHLLQEYPEGKVIIFGRSIGSGVAVKLAAETQPRLLILETPMYTLLDLAKRHYPILPAGLLLRYTFRSDQWIGQVNCPIYMLHGTADSIIPHEAAEQLAAKATAPVEVILIPGGGHNDLSLYPPYREALDRILGNNE